VIALDASTLVAHFDESDVHHGAVRVLDLGAHTLVVSPITLAEFFVGPTRAGAMALAQDVTARIGLEVVPLSEDAPARLALLRVETGLRLPDCCVVLAAEQTGADIATFDDRLANAARKRGLVVLA